MGKNALVITYHVKNCKRKGGFHYFIKYLEELSYCIDWVTCPVSLSWALCHNDRENMNNLIGLWKGIHFTERDAKVYHFASPVFLPARLAELLKMKLGRNYWPKWKRIRKRLKAAYDVILVEGVGCQYAQDLKNNYPDAQIIYRPSDILKTFSNAPNADMLEIAMIKTADRTLCVDENQLAYYKKLIKKDGRLKVLRNPLASKENIKIIKSWKPSGSQHKTVIYIGVSFVDLDMIEYAASQNGIAEFLVIGPFSRTSHDNIKYLGSLEKKQYITYLETANVGICPIKSQHENVFYGYTRKIIQYMQYLMPIVATCSDNYLNVAGFKVAHGADEFAKFVGDALTYTTEDRIQLRDGYLKVIELFLEDKCRNQFFECLNSKKEEIHRCTK